MMIKLSETRAKTNLCRKELEGDSDASSNSIRGNFKFLLRII